LGRVWYEAALSIKRPLPLFQLGFRPFYALAAIFASVAVIVWLSAFAGFSGTGVYLQSVNWHSHEMLFGFSVAVITGFLLTAVRNWTGLPTPTGPALAALAGLWLLARVLIITGPGPLAAVVDVLFLPTLAVAVAIPILRSKNTRNYKVIAVLLALATCHGVFHLASQGVLPAWLSRATVFASIDILIILLAIVAGRVVPAFTKNAMPASNPRSERWVEVVVFLSMILLVVTTLISGVWMPISSLLAGLLLVVAAGHALRLALWDPLRTLHQPLLWMMPAAYSWIAFAFVLRALAVTHVVAPSAWIHAVTMGAISSFMIAMMMRSSLGHTGRDLVASRSDMAVFVFVQLAAIVRITGSIAAGESYRYWVAASGLIWCLAFLLFALRYLPMLGRSRVDD
jgi:uncharacterized protein involved in response to NO